MKCLSKLFLILIISFLQIDLIAQNKSSHLAAIITTAFVDSVSNSVLESNVFLQRAIKTPYDIQGRESIFLKDSILKCINVTDLKEDFKIFRAALEQSHPGLYWHTSKAYLDHAFDSAYSRITGPMNTLEYARVIFPIVYDIGCGHTFINLPNYTTAYLAKEARFFPFDIIFNRDKAYVYNNNSDDFSIEPGSEILKINNQPIKEIKDRLFRFISADNNTSTGKYRVLNYNFVDFYNYYIGNPDTFHVLIRNHRQQRTVNIAALLTDVIAKNKNSNAINHRIQAVPVGNSLNRVLSLHIISKHSTAILKVKNFIDPYIEAEGSKFTSYIDTAFQKLKDSNINNLIIDIRGNPGGSSGNASYLFSYLTNKPFRVDEYWEVKTLPLTYIDFSDIKDSEGKPILLKDEDFVKNDNGRRRLKKYPSFDTIQPKPNHFTGKVYVLIDGWVGSEAAAFASLVHHSKGATFIGEQTGGSYNGCTAGILGKTILPNTRIQITIPVFKIVRFTDPQNENKGIEPDYLIEPSIHDLLYGVDRELVFTLNKINYAFPNTGIYKSVL